MEKHIFIDEKYSGLTVRKILMKEGFSHNVITKFSKTAGRFTVNGQTVFSNFVVKAGDEIVIDMSEVEKNSIIPVKMDLDILYEDEQYLCINKKAGIATIPTHAHYLSSLAGGVVYYMQEKKPDFIFRAVNRLDKETSGAILIAKSPFAQSKLSKQKITKKYFLFCEGTLKETEGKLDFPVYDDKVSQKRTVDVRGQSALTLYKVIESGNDMSYVSAQLETGRTHQIRLHFSHIGHALIGDKLYGKESGLIGRCALHSSQIGFFHPFLEKEINITAPLAEDIEKLLLSL